MARDSYSYPPQRRQHSCSISSPTHPPSLVSSPSTCSSKRTTSTPGSFSSYAPTSLSGYRRRTAVAGSPSGDYFTSGNSKTDRRLGYCASNASSRLPDDEPKPLVRYEGASSSGRRSERGGGQRESRLGKESSSSSSSREKRLILHPNYGRDSRRYDSEDDDEEDYATVLPSDSISQISSPGLSTARRSDSGRGDVVATTQRGSTFSGVSMFQGPSEFDSTRGFFVMERRPRRGS